MRAHPEPINLCRPADVAQLICRPVLVAATNLRVPPTLRARRQAPGEPRGGGKPGGQTLIFHHAPRLQRAERTSLQVKSLAPTVKRQEWQTNRLRRRGDLMNRLSAAVVEPLAAAWRRPAGLQDVCRAAVPAACDMSPFSLPHDDLTSGKGIGASDARGLVLSAGYAVRLRGKVA